MFFTLFIVTYTYIFFSDRSSIRRRTPSMLSECSPTDIPRSGNLRTSVRMFDARLFSVPEPSTSELLRTL